MPTRTNLNTGPNTETRGALMLSAARKRAASWREVLLDLRTREREARDRLTTVRSAIRQVEAERRREQ